MGEGEGAQGRHRLRGPRRAGKGGTIKAITERVSPRVFRVVALAAPTEREKSQMYIQRYLSHMPAAGEVVIFDRSWYNRAGVERVMGFATDEQVEGFLKIAPLFENLMIHSGIILLKYWLEVNPDEQTRRLTARVDDGRKIWKLTAIFGVIEASCPRARCRDIGRWCRAPRHQGATGPRTLGQLSGGGRRWHHGESREIRRDL
jgi:hypothetical protein